MIKFERYPHINDLITYYLGDLPDNEVRGIINSAVKTENDAEIFSKFIWRMVDKMNADQSAGMTVLGSIDNSDMLPDLSYEVTKYMRQRGYFEIWEKISDSV